MKNITLCILLIFCSLSCQKTKDPYTIPLVQVEISIYTTDPIFFNLNIVGGWEYITGGSRGIIIYRNSQSQFRAYERHCPYQPSNSCGRVAVDSTNIFVVDTCCGSEFLLVDGTVTKDPSLLPLKEYRTSFSNDVLRIYN